VFPLLDFALQAFDLLVVVAPLGHDPHGGVQLGLFGLGVVALKHGDGATLSRGQACLEGSSRRDARRFHVSPAPRNRRRCHGYVLLSIQSEVPIPVFLCVNTADLHEASSSDCYSAAHLF